MSRLKTVQGDDHPEAAGKHLLDAGALLAAGRADGAAYLSGYVVECSLKSIYQLETGTSLWGHDLPTLSARVSAVATVVGARTARYFGGITASAASSAIASWRPEMRYAAPIMSASNAAAWQQIAGRVFQETIAQMRLDGEL